MFEIHDENRAKLRGRIVQRFWIKEPRHSETISDEKGYLYRYRNTRRLERTNSRTTC